VPSFVSYRGDRLKDPASLYRPGERSPALLKLKPMLTLDVKMTGGSAERIAWGDRARLWCWNWSISTLALASELRFARLSALLVSGVW